MHATASMEQTLPALDGLAYSLIASQLDVDVVNLFRVSKEFRSMGMHTRQLTLSSRLFKEVTRTSQRHVGVPVRDVVRDVREFLKRFKLLTEITVTGAATDIKLHDVRECFPALQVLCIKGMSAEPEVRLRIDRTLQDLAALTSLTRLELVKCQLGGKRFTDTIADLPVLQALDIRSCHFSGAHSFTFNVRCPSLDKITVLDTTVNKMVVICPILTRLKVDHVETLDVELCPALRFADTDVDKVSGANNVTHLVFAHWDWESQTELSVLFPKVVDLTLNKGTLRKGVMFNVAGHAHLTILRCHHVNMKVQTSDCPVLETMVVEKVTGETLTMGRQNGSWVVVT